MFERWSPKSAVLDPIFVDLWCKLGSKGIHFPLKDRYDWYNYTIDQFGPDRCMFESNFPVDKLSCSYTVLWNQFKKLTKDFSKDERAAMFHDTAMRVYRLPRV